MNTIERDNALKQASDAALAEARLACSKWPPMNSVHEGYAVILEELDELWQEAKQKVPSKDRLRVEARHVAAMAIRFAAELTLLVLLFLASNVRAQNIATKIITPGAPTRIQLSPSLTTTLLFPSTISGVFGLGMVNGTTPNADGVVQVQHPDGSNVLVLHALSESAHVMMTVLLDGQLYVLDAQSGPQPDVALTLVKSDPSAPRAVEVSPEEIKAVRPKMDPEIFIGLERKAHDAPLLRKKYPDLYQGYAWRSCDYTSDSGTVKTTVSTIHRFSKEDAVVLEGTVQNETDKPIQFDGRAVTAQVANEVHPAKLTDCLRTIPAGATVPIVVVLQGDIDGGRSNLSIENEFRIMLPGDTGNVWAFKNGSRTGKPFKVPEPEPKQPIPLTQTEGSK